MGFKLGWTTIVFNGLFTTAAHVQNRMRSATRSSHPQNELLRLEYGMPQHWVAIRWNNEVICWRHTGQPVITMSAASSRHGDTPKSCRNQPRSEVLCESVLCYPHWYGTIDIDWYATMCYNKIKIEEPRGYTGTLLLSVEETTGRSHRRVSNWLVEGLIRYENHTNRNPHASLLQCTWRLGHFSVNARASRCKGLPLRSLTVRWGNCSARNRHWFEVTGVVVSG